METGKLEGPAQLIDFRPASSHKDWRVICFGQNPNRTLCRVLIWGVIIVTCFHHLLLPIQIIGSSMTPTYHTGSLNFVNRWSYTALQPKRGDVVAVRVDGELLLKRIVALPGETVSISRGELWINDAVHLDEFSIHIIPWEMKPVALRAGEYFVIGDNRSASVFCAVEKRSILGKIVF